MHTLTIKIQDSVFQEFLNFVSQRKATIEITKDKNLEYDPYFYERKQQLQQDINDIDSGEVEMLSQEQYDNEMNSFFTQLKSKYAN